MRARNIKPGFFTNDRLAELPYEGRLLFVGLWCLADREGRIEDRPKKIKGEIFPFDSIEIEPLLDQLCVLGFISRYNVNGTSVIAIPNFLKHQKPHFKEKLSILPAMTSQVGADHNLGQCSPQPRLVLTTTQVGAEHQPKPPYMTAQVGADHNLGQCQSALNPDILNPDILNPDRRSCEIPEVPNSGNLEYQFDPLKAQNEAKRLTKIYTERTKCPHSSGGCEKAIYALLNASEATPSILEAAIDGYVEKLRREGTPQKFIKSGKSFFGDGAWEEHKDGKAPAPIDDDPQNLRKATARLLAEKAERRRQIELERPEQERQDAEFLKTYGVPRTFLNRGLAGSGKLKPLAEIAAEAEQRAQGGAA